jgi:hypothetical protein
VVVATKNIALEDAEGPLAIDARHLAEGTTERIDKLVERDTAVVAPPVAKRTQLPCLRVDATRGRWLLSAELVERVAQCARLK